MIDADLVKGVWGLLEEHNFFLTSSDARLLKHYLKILLSLLEVDDIMRLCWDVVSAFIVLPTTY